MSPTVPLAQNWGHIKLFLCPSTVKSFSFARKVRLPTRTFFNNDKKRGENINMALIEKWPNKL